MNEYMLKLSEPVLQRIVDALAQQPYGLVAGIVADIHAQVSEQDASRERDRRAAIEREVKEALVK